MLLKYILVFIIINNQLTFSIAGNVKRHRKSNNPHTKAKKNKLSDVNPPGFVPTEDISDVGDLEWLSESTKTRNVVLTQSKNKKESTSESPAKLDTRDADKQLADYKASQQADDLVSKMSLKKVMVKEIMEVDKVYETGSTEIIINPRDLWNEKNSNQPAMKVVQYLFEKPTTTTPAYETIDIKVFESVKTVESTFSPNKLPTEPTEPPTTPQPPPPPMKSPRRKKPQKQATRKPTLKPLDFDEFLKVIFGNYGKKKEKERDEVDVESDTKLGPGVELVDDEDDVKFSSDVTKIEGKPSSDVINVKSKVVQTRNSQPTTQKPCDEDEEEVETTVEETNTSVVATKFVEEEPEDFELVEKTVGKRSKVKRNPERSSGKSSPKGAKRLATPKKTRSCRKKRVEKIEIDDSFKETGPDYEEFSTNIVYTISVND